MRLRRPFLFILLGLFILPFLTNCSSAEPAGTLGFYANGEEFIWNGFTSVDGYEIDFDHVYVNLSDVAAFQTDPPYDAADGNDPADDATATATVADSVRVDLASADGPILVAEVDTAVGQYNAISWTMPADPDNSVELIGTASRDGETISFTITFADSFGYACGEYVGDTRKGFVREGESSTIEMTFHIDHVFGDGDSPADEPLNQGALGFGPLAALASNGSLEADSGSLQAQLSAADFATLTDTLGTLGHVGEGHCFEATNGYTGG